MFESSSGGGAPVRDLACRPTARDEPWRCGSAEKAAGKFKNCQDPALTAAASPASAARPRWAAPPHEPGWRGRGSAGRRRWCAPRRGIAAVSCRSTRSAPGLQPPPTPTSTSSLVPRPPGCRVQPPVAVPHCNPGGILGGSDLLPVDEAPRGGHDVLRLRVADVAGSGSRGTPARAAISAAAADGW